MVRQAVQQALVILSQLGDVVDRKMDDALADRKMAHEKMPVSIVSNKLIHIAIAQPSLIIQLGQSDEPCRLEPIYMDSVVEWITLSIFFSFFLLLFGFLLSTEILHGYGM